MTSLGEEQPDLEAALTRAVAEFGRWWRQVAKEIAVVAQQMIDAFRKMLPAILAVVPACECVCQQWHRRAYGVCTGKGTASVTVATTLLGAVDVAMCPNCAREVQAA